MSIAALSLVLGHIAIYGGAQAVAMLAAAAPFSF